MVLFLSDKILSHCFIGSPMHPPNDKDKKKKKTRDGRDDPSDNEDTDHERDNDVSNS